MTRNPNSSPSASNSRSKFHIRQKFHLHLQPTNSIPSNSSHGPLLTTLQCPPPHHHHHLHHHLLPKYLLNTLSSTPTTAYVQPSSSQAHTSSPISPFVPLPRKTRSESFLYHDFLVPPATTQRPQQHLPLPPQTPRQQSKHNKKNNNKKNNNSKNSDNNTIHRYLRRRCGLQGNPL